MKYHEYEYLNFQVILFGIISHFTYNFYKSFHSVFLDSYFFVFFLKIKVSG